ncbi:MAG: hypothetical protein CSA22_09285 [Deltaproteobacteria bacterium]|nr:MAG: hypothetical protein CSA22_09285 [Deltaproteobacteria bacterium]
MRDTFLFLILICLEINLYFDKLAIAETWLNQRGGIAKVFTHSANRIRTANPIFFALLIVLFYQTIVF